jgi:flagellar biosynthesis/type III secretory pathway chaperone
MNAMAYKDRIATVLKQQIDAAGALQGLLNQERAALESRDLETFDKIITQKQAQVAQLDDLERARNKLVQQAGFPGEPEKFNEYLSALGQGSALSQQSEQLKALLSECFQLNRINAGMVELSYHYLNQSLAVLRGTEGHQKDTYGPQGKHIESADSQRTIAKV